jgi:subtilisin family serine protease
MNRKKIFMIGIFTLGIALGIFGVFGAISQAQGANTLTEWKGSWQMGPSLDTTILGCPAGNGLGRYTGIYYPPNNRVYFLGGRCENNTTTTGSVFYYDVAASTYAATGAVMPVPVSNYQMVQIDDGGVHGPGFYIVGGRKGDGSQATELQVYYPDDNTVQVIATDPFPPAVPYSPGGVASQSDKIYVFGGFSGTAMVTETYVYNPAAAAGSRWTLSDCDLPTPRSYIAAVAVGDMIYAIGGDEWDGSTLVPITDTLVLDTADLGACWQDDLMADLPAVNGDAPAVYVPPEDEPIGGGIFVVGGNFTTIDRLVFRYDLVGDLWEEFRQLVIPDPATGRRNQALAYLPSTASGDGTPGLWTFGGYDGSGTNAMTETSEFFHNSWLLPHSFEWTGFPGTTLADTFTVYNLADDIPDTFDLSFTSDVTWTVGLPTSVGPIPANSQADFEMTVDIPAGVGCGEIGMFYVTATSQADPMLTETDDIMVRVICGVGGTIFDADTGLPIENAYVWIQADEAGLGTYYDAFTDADGKFVMLDVTPGTYYMGADALGHQPSFYPDGWPDGAIMLDVTPTEPAIQNITLVASNIAWDPDAITVTLPPSTMVTRTLTIDNSGSGPYYYNISLLDEAMPEPPIGTLAVPGLPRLDEQIFTDIAASPDGTTDFVVVLNDQADVSAANSITDWNERGQVVYNTLNSFAETHQVALRSFLNSQDVDYTPLYIINAVIVHSGDANLVNNLAARQDVSQLVANHKIAVEDQSSGYINTLLTPVTVPDAVEWNIHQIKADAVWITYTVTGENVVVAEIDTGTQYDHPALKNQYRGNNGDGTYDHNYNWYDPYEQCPSGGTIPCDGAQHGTHVMGTMVGDDGGANQIGVAPGAQWISCKGGDSVSGYLLTNELLVCAQWILAPFDLTGANPDPSMRPNVVNNSWGGGPNDYWYTGAVSAWRAAGIFPAFATGNSGPSCSSAHSPGDNWNSFGVGATDADDNIAGFSGRGPAEYTGFLKPQVTAPGVNIRSSVPYSTYQSGWNGTSMATPHVAGAVALLLSAAPELVGQVDLTAWTLEQSALPLLTNEGCGGDLPTDVPNNTFGWGRLDIYAAVTMALGGGLTPDWVSVSPQSGMIDPMSSADITITFTAGADRETKTATLWLVGDDPYNWDVRIPLTMNVGFMQKYLPFVWR